MKLSIQNTAKIKNATIEIDGITVLAGLNNTGKSTIGKTLFAVINSLSDMHIKIQKQRVDSIARRSLDLLLRIGLMEKLPFASMTRTFSSLSEIVSEWLENKYAKTGRFAREDLLSILRDALKENAPKLLEDLGDEIISSTQEAVHEVLSLDNDSIVKVIVTKYFHSVFQGELNSRLPNTGQKTNTAKIRTTIQGKNIDLNFVQEACKKATINIPLSGRAIYISKPDVLDDIFLPPGQLGNPFSQNYDYKNYSLAELLIPKGDIEEQAAETAIVTGKLQKVVDTIDCVIHSRFVKGKLQEEGLEEPILFCNSSSGLKVFSLIQMLITKNALRPKDVLIFDEPEIHLHPQWQIIMAHVIVLLQKHLDLTILVTTHSPYFSDAISLYGKKYKIYDKIRYYYASLNSNRSVDIKDITDEPSIIYKKISSVIMELDKLRTELM